MKKELLTLALSCTLLLSLSACGGGTEDASSTPEPSISTSDASTSPSASSQSIEDTQQDDMGIPGMDSFTIRLVLESSPFSIPLTDGTIASPEAINLYAQSYVSSGSEDPNVLYDYSITEDLDGEIIGATFGITSAGASEQELLTAADLFFYAVSIIPYDTADEDTLTAWFESTLPTVSESGESITVGDATFELYGMPGSMYWVDISKSV